MGSLVLLTLALAVGQVATPGQTVPSKPAQTTPARDQKPPAKGTSVIKGFVVDAKTGKPIRRAMVRSSGGPVSGSAQTDGDGRFEIGELPAGKYDVSASKAAYLSSNDPSLAKRPDPIVLGDNQTVEKVVLALTKGGVIAGNVLDEAGDPLSGAEVRVLRYRYVNGSRQLTQYYGGGVGFPVLTDDLGGFRLYGLAPGDYYLSANASRGNFMPPDQGASNVEGPGPTYYPGTANASEARRIVVRAGAETTGIVFPVTLVRLSRIRGTVQSAEPEAFAGGNVMVSLRDNGGGINSSSGGPIRPDGSFEVANVPPGTYTLDARPAFQSGEQPNVIARLSITVNGEDLNGFVIFAGVAGIARGRIVTDDGTPLPFPPRSIRIGAQSADPQSSSFGSAPPTVQNDGTFEVKRLLGPMHLRAFPTIGPGTPPPEQWTFKGVLLDGRDVTDTGIDFQLGQIVEGIDLVFTRKISKLTGRVQAGSVARNKIRLIVFPEDESKWVAQSRYIRPGGIDPENNYTMTLVPYDSYLIAAVLDVEDGQWTDPEFLRSLRDVATRFSLGEGETKVQDLKIVDWRK